MDLIKIINGDEVDNYIKSNSQFTDDKSVNSIVSEIIAAVRAEGDTAVRRYAKQFEKEAGANYGVSEVSSEISIEVSFEVSLAEAKKAWENLKTADPVLAGSLSLAADNIRRFSELQKDQLKDFETEISPGLFTGQRVIPVDRAAIYVPAGRFPLISSALMGLIPAATAGVREKILVSPPRDKGLPDSRILAAAYLAKADRIFALGGAQAIAALALGTETIPRADLIVGAGNKYVAAAKRLLYGEVGIDLVAGPTDVLIIIDKPGADAGVSGAKAGTAVVQAGASAAAAADLIAADMLAQAEHDPDARARTLVPDMETAEQIVNSLEKRLARLSTAATAKASLEAGGLIVIYSSREEAISIANRIAPEHLELHVSSAKECEEWTGGLKNYGSLFIGSLAAEVLGDYSAGINHTLPTSASARFTGGLSVRHFLKTVTTLRCVQDSGYAKAIDAAEAIARAEGLAGHAESAALRSGKP